MSKYQFHLLGFFINFYFLKHFILVQLWIFTFLQKDSRLSRSIECQFDGNFGKIWENFGAHTIQMTVHKIPVHVCNLRTHGTLLNPHFMNINGNLWIFMNFERALRVCLFLNTFLERSFEFVKCLVCQLCFCTLDFVWIPFSGVKFKIFSKFFSKFSSDTYKRRQRPHTEPL